jgi:nucleotide-binding universal stress UspA family protein
MHDQFAPRTPVRYQGSLYNKIVVPRQLDGFTRGNVYGRTNFPNHQGGASYMINPTHVAAPARAHALATLVAAGDGDEARAAIRVASALAAAGRIVPQVIIVDSMSVGESPQPTVDSREVVRTPRVSREVRQDPTGIRAALEVAGGGRWPLLLRAGDPVTQIVHDAVHGEFQLVVMGLRRHDAIVRLTERETTLGVARLSAVPVLGVVSWLHHIPRRIVVGYDFSPSSQRSVDIACRVLADGGTLMIAYAETAFDGAPDTVVHVHFPNAHAQLASLIDQLPLPAGAHVETAPLSGSPAIELLNMADRVSADAIAVGRQHHSLASRVLFGSVSADLLRDARCSVLVAPAFAT